MAVNSSFFTLHSSLSRWLLTLVVACAAIPASAQKDTLIIACDWDFAPYEYSIDGKAVGYNIDVIHTILKELNIPHKFQFNARKQSISLFQDKKADLIFDYRGRFAEGPYYSTANPLGYYNIVAAHRVGTPDITSVAQLNERDTIALNRYNDSIVHTVLGDAIPESNIVFCSPREALSSVNDSLYSYFIWGEEPMKWKIKELNLTDIVYNKLNVPTQEIHIVGHDKKLIDNIESQYARLSQRGEIDRLDVRWFHPERVAEQSSRTAAIIIALSVFLLAVFVIALHFLTRKRLRSAMRRSEEMGAMMHQALSMGNYSVMILDLKQNRVTNQHGDILPPGGITMQELMKHVHPDDREAMINRRRNRSEEKERVKPFSMRWNIGTPEQPVWKNTTGYSYPEFDEHGRPVNIVIISRDITDEVTHEVHDRETASRYLRMFDSSLLAMSFYDKDGHLLDLNEKMKKLCEITSEKSLEFFRNSSIFDIELLRGDFLPGSTDEFHFCQHMLYPEMGIDKYIEVRVTPNIDENGQLMYYILTVSDVTAERSLYMELKRQNEVLQQTEETNRRYEQEMRTLLTNCNMYVWHVDLATNIISFSRSLGSVEFTRTMEEHIESMYEEDRQQAIQTAQKLKEMDSTFSVVHHFRYTPIDDEPTWYATSGMPLKDEKGNITGLFGIVRNVTQLMQAQEQLKKETARAENSGMLKSAFLANMTHEIRTPLNAIVGFTDLLHMIDEPEQRKEFVRIIRNNCDMLMRLINDIFEASTMDVKPLEIKPEEVDFAKFFTVISQSLAQRVQEPGVEFIVENPYSSFVTVIDKGRMQQVITNFVTNAVKYTHQGHIRIGYQITGRSASEECRVDSDSSVECRVDSVEFATALESEEYRVDSESSVECRVDSVEFATALDASTDGERSAKGSAVAARPLVACYQRDARNSKLYTLNSTLNDEEEGLYMYCEDTGAGIPKEKQQSVFERFVKLNDFVQGTGLGLSICKSIAERSNGRIGVDSEGEGHGSTFWIWVPCHVLSLTSAADSQQA